jgi:hypothetical protein
METPKTPSNLEPNAVESLPDKPVTDSDADAVKGGAVRRIMGGDDDLEDLEVERFR